MRDNGSSVCVVYPILSRAKNIHMKWKQGRQGSNYSVLTLISSKMLGLDMHIIHYPPNGRIPKHTDKVEGMNHHRVNITLKGCGMFYCDNYKKWGRIIYFRPDKEVHSFTNSNKDRYVLSIGWVSKRVA